MTPWSLSFQTDPSYTTCWDFTHLVAMACSQPPEGRVSWTLQMPAGGLMEREIVDSVSTEIVAGL